MTDAPKLLPCPFCGATPHRQLGKIVCDSLHGDAHQYTVVKCPHLCATMTGSASGVVERWNTRAPITAQDALAPITAQDALAVPEVAELVKALRWIAKNNDAGDYMYLADGPFAKRAKAALAAAHVTETPETKHVAGDVSKGE